MKGLFQFALGCWLVAGSDFAATAGFSSLQVFGDGVSTTTNNPFAGQYYYGLRRSNGRVWVEVLAERLGLGANSVTNVNWSNASNNWSYYGQYSFNLMTNVNSFATPTNVQTALFVVWVNNADFVNYMGTIYPSTNIVTWTNAINQSLTNHYNIVTNLYAKGVRTLLMPNAVDVTEIPAYDNLQVSAPATRNFIRQQVIGFNVGFSQIVNRAKTDCPGLTIYVPDFFALLDNVLTNAAAYDLTNALYNGVSIDAYDDPALYATLAINGPGTNYIFWDKSDPTAKLHAVIADLAHQIISPVQIAKITLLNGSNRLDVANVPIGLDGFVRGSTNLLDWADVQGFSSSNATQTVVVPPSSALMFYRLRFPYAWSWP